MATKTYTDPDTNIRIKYITDDWGRNSEALSAADTPPLFKIVGPQGEPLHGGRLGNSERGAWPLPTKKRTKWTPGDWVTVEGTLQMCRTGLHLTDASNMQNWTGYGDDWRVFLAEVEGPVISDRNKYLAQKVRLVREIPHEDAKRIIEGGSVPKSQWLEGERYNELLAYWSDEARYAEVFACVKHMLPLDYLAPTDLHEIESIVRPRQFGSVYRADWARNFSDARKTFFEGRYRYLLALGQKETEQQREERLNSKKSGRMIARFIESFLDVRYIHDRAEQYGGERGAELKRKFQRWNKEMLKRTEAAYEKENAEYLALLKELGVS